MKIHLLNYEKYANDYLDGTLAPDLVEDMDLFLTQHPQIKAELNQMAATSWPPLGNETYGDKSELYRQSGFRTIYRWWSIAAAVMIFVAAGWFYVYLSKPTESISPAQVNLADHITEPSTTILNSDQVPPVEIAEPQVTHHTPPQARSIHQFNPAGQQQNSLNHEKPQELLAILVDHSPGIENSAMTDPMVIAEPLTDVVVAHQEVAEQMTNLLPRCTFAAIPGPNLFSPEPVALIPAKTISPDVTAPFTPEAYSGLSQGSSLRNAFIPEVLVGLFSKSK